MASTQYLFELEPLPEPRHAPRRPRPGAALTPGAKLALNRLRETLERQPAQEVEEKRRRWQRLERNLAEAGPAPERPRRAARRRRLAPKIVF